MSSIEDAYAQLAAERGLEQLETFGAGPLTPLLVESKGSQLQPAVDLRDPGHGERQVTLREIMSVFAANRIEPGIVLPAYVNPKDPDDFVLVW